MAANKAPGDYRSPLAPGPEAVGQPSAYTTDVRNLSGEPSQNTTPVIKQSSKDAAADPSLGTAVARPHTMERTGARYRINPVSNFAVPNHPSSGAVLANTVPVTTPPGVIPDGSKEYPAGSNETFDDAEVAAGRPGGTQRQRGYSAFG